MHADVPILKLHWTSVWPLNVLNLVTLIFICAIKIFQDSKKSKTYEKNFKSQFSIIYNNYFIVLKYYLLSQENRLDKKVTVLNLHFIKLK